MLSMPEHQLINKWSWMKMIETLVYKQLFTNCDLQIYFCVIVHHIPGKFEKQLETQL
jgi:hypothetical protein